MIEVGSMIVRAKFEAGNIYAGLSSVISKLKESALTSKSVTTEFKRMKGTLIGLAAAAGLTAGSILGMLTKAIMQSPFLAAALEKLKMQFMLFGNAIAKHVAPILDKFVNLIKWLREKFQALPDSVQGAIVKIIAFAAIVLVILISVKALAILLAGAAAGFAILVPAGLLATLGAIAAGIWGIIAGSIALQAIIGVVIGVLGVLALDRMGVLSWISDVGEGFRNWDSIVRDVIISLLGIPALIGGIAIDISRGDLGFSTTKAWGEEWKSSLGRVGGSAIYGTYEYGQGSSSTSRAQDWEAYSSKTAQSIGTQNNNINVDASGITGDMNDPATLWAFTQSLTEGMAEEQNSYNY